MPWFNDIATAKRRTYGDGGAYIGVPWRIVLHTTENSDIDAALAEFATKPYASHFLVGKDRDGVMRCYQMFDTDRAARALEHRGAPETNRANAIQIEMVGFAGRPKPPELLAATKVLVDRLCTHYSIPKVWFMGHCVPPVNGRDSNRHDRDNPKLLPGIIKTWLTDGGICAHEHVPRNVHWDIAATAVEEAQLFTPTGPDDAHEAAGTASSVPVAPPATYRITRGDTLTGVVKRFSTTIAAIVAANHLANPDQIFVGQVLKLPT